MILRFSNFHPSLKMNKNHKDSRDKNCSSISLYIYIERIFYIQNLELQMANAKVSLTAIIDFSRDKFTEMSSATERLTTFC